MKTVRTNQGYKVDSPAEFAVIVFKICRAIAKFGIRYRTELALATLIVAGYLWIQEQIGGNGATGCVLAAAGIVFGWPKSRVLLLGRLRCSRSRRRLARVFRETDVDNDVGAVPLVVRSRLTPAGERYRLWLRIGQSMEAADQKRDAIRAALHCRDARLVRDENRAHKLTIEVIRRDTLAGITIDSPLVAYAADLDRKRVGAP